MGNWASTDGSTGVGGKTPLPVSTRAIENMDKKIRLQLLQSITPKYSLKLVIRGARKTGKTCLLNRLCGKAFTSEYAATPEIQTSIHNWSYAGDYVRVESWEVVDVGFLPGCAGSEAKAGVDPDRLAGLPKDIQAERTVLDARTIDPYVNADCVVVLFRVDDSKSVDQALNLAEESPKEVPLLFLQTFIDVNGNVDKRISRSVAKLQKAGRMVHFLQISSKTGQGLNVLYEYLKVPFLNKRRKELQLAMDLCCKEYTSVLERLSTMRPENKVKLSTVHASSGTKFGTYDKPPPSLETSATRKKDENVLEAFLNEDPMDVLDSKKKKDRERIEQCRRGR